jgi:hypothetical protein
VSHGTKVYDARIIPHLPQTRHLDGSTVTRRCWRNEGDGIHILSSAIRCRWGGTKETTEFVVRIFHKSQGLVVVPTLARPVGHDAGTMFPNWE